MESEIKYSVTDLIISIEFGIQISNCLIDTGINNWISNH